MPFVSDFRLKMNTMSSRASVTTLLMLCLGTCTYSSKTPLYIGGIIELSDLPSWFQFSSVIEDIVYYTLADINNMTGLLEEYDLQIILKDVGVGII